MMKFTERETNRAMHALGQSAILAGVLLIGILLTTQPMTEMQVGTPQQIQQFRPELQCNAACKAGQASWQTTVNTQMHRHACKVSWTKSDGIPVAGVVFKADPKAHGAMPLNTVRYLPFDQAFKAAKQGWWVAGWCSR